MVLDFLNPVLKSVFFLFLRLYKKELEYNKNLDHISGSKVFILWRIKQKDLKKNEIRALKKLTQINVIIALGL
jgi:hypothetical protein